MNGATGAAPSLDELTQDSHIRRQLGDHIRNLGKTQWLRSFVAKSASQDDNAVSYCSSTVACDRDVIGMAFTEKSAQAKI